MSVLIIAEHDNQQLNPATLHAVSAAAKLGDVHVLVAGEAAGAVAEAARKISGVSKVLLAEAPHYAAGLAEELAPLVVQLAADYSSIGATATAFGKNLLPRVVFCPDCANHSFCGNCSGSALHRNQHAKRYEKH